MIEIRSPCGFAVHGDGVGDNSIRTRGPRCYGCRQSEAAVQDVAARRRASRQGAQVERWRVQGPNAIRSDIAAI
jgi:hypothetical protein